MNRRQIIAAPAALALGAVPAAADGETPVKRLYREWLAQERLLPQVEGRPQAEIDAAYDLAHDMLNMLLAEPSQTPGDTALKLFAAIENADMFFHEPFKDALYAEARALVGA